MIGLAIFLTAVMSLSIGFAAGSLVTRARVRGAQYFREAIQAAETRGRIEAMTGKPVKPGLEPPRPLL